MAVLTGIDGCKAGWVAAMESDGSTWVSIFPHLEEWLVEHRPDVVAIDIPIGLDSGPSGVRACDQEARALLRPKRASSVFPAPLRQALLADDRAQADRISRSVCGKGVGAQSFGIYRKVASVDALLQSKPEWRSRIYEVHPELSFATWAGGPMKASKHTFEGREERRALVVSEFGASCDELLDSIPRGCKMDDVLDAFAALWTARRIARGIHEFVPKTEIADETGLLMRIAA